MNPELAHLVAHARHRLLGTPLDNEEVNRRQAVDSFRDWLISKVSVETKTQLMFGEYTTVGDRPARTFNIDGTRFTLVWHPGDDGSDGCDLISDVEAQWIPADDKFEDRLLVAIGDGMESPVRQR